MFNHLNYFFHSNSVRRSAFCANTISKCLCDSLEETILVSKDKVGFLVHVNFVDNMVFEFHFMVEGW